MSAKVAESASSRASIRDPPEKRLFARLFLSRARARYRYFSFRVSVFAHSSRIFSDLLKRYIIFSSNSIRAIDSNLLAKCPKWIQQGCSFDWNVILYSCS